MKKIFKEAHKMTKGLVEKYDVDYQAQFGLCLQFLLDESKELIDENDLEKELIKQMETEGNTEIEIKNFNCNKWANYGKERVYIEMAFMYNGQHGNFKAYIDHTDDNNILTRNLTGSGSHRYNDMIKIAYSTVRNNINNILNF